MANLQIFSLFAIALAIAGRYLWDYTDTTEHCYTLVTTLSDTNPQATCFSVSRSGLFKHVYNKTRDSASSDRGYVLPGLWDGHGHILQYGELLHSANLFQSQSLSEVYDRIGEYLDENPDEGSAASWIRGIGWDQATFGNVMPTAADLEIDDRLRGKYIMLDRVDVHCVWISQAVLDLLPSPLPDSVEGGEIVRKPGLGVFCDNAVDIIKAVFPQPSKERKMKWLQSAMTSLNSVGLVGMHDAGALLEEIEIFQENIETGHSTLRVYAMLACEVRNSFCPEASKRISTPDGFLNVNSVKLFADGALGSWGSAMLDPYSDRPEETGSLLVNATTLTYLAESWASLGFQVNIHAIGDLANRIAIDALTAALRITCPDASSDLQACQEKARFRIEHSQIIHPDDQTRMRNIGIIPSIQPTHATSDMAYAEDRLGPERTRSEAYRMRSFLDLKPVLGSDFPVEPPVPFEGIFAAVTRRSPRTGKGRLGAEEGWHTEETLTIKEALLGFTRNAAYGAFLEDKAGVIAPGAWADWIVVDRDVLKTPPDELRNVVVQETWVGGKRVFKQGG